MENGTYEERTNLSIRHLLRLPAGSSSAGPQIRYPGILALHGHGGNERNLIGLSEHFSKNLLWISGRGPVEPEPGAYDWYPVTEFGKPDPIQLESALRRIDQFIGELLENYPIDPQKLFLLGFSQGSMISLAYLLTRPKAIAGVIAQSGYVPLQSGIQVDEAGVKGKPVIMTHGTKDTRMPLEWSYQSRDFLLSHGVAVEHHTFPMGHAITPDSLAAIQGWINCQL